MIIFGGCSRESGASTKNCDNFALIQFDIGSSGQ